MDCPQEFDGEILRAKFLDLDMSLTQIHRLCSYFQNLVPGPLCIVTVTVTNISKVDRFPPPVVSIIESAGLGIVDVCFDSLALLT